MARNIEIKAWVKDPEELEKKVQRLEGYGPEQLFQDDTFFRCPNGRLKLRVFDGGSGELIFYSRPDQDGPKESFYRKTAVSDPDELRDVLSNAYGTAGRVRKNRTLYIVGRTRIHLDHVEGLGDFMELEVMLEEGEAPEVGEQEAYQLMKEFNVDPAGLIKEAYIDMMKSE